MRSEDRVILEPGNDGDSDIAIEVDELFGNEGNIEHENENDTIWYIYPNRLEDY